MRRYEGKGDTADGMAGWTWNRERRHVARQSSRQRFLRFNECICVQLVRRDLSSIQPGLPVVVYPALRVPDGRVSL